MPALPLGMANYAMRARVPILRARDAMAKSMRVEGLSFSDTVIVVRSSSSTACDSDDSNLCQKPTGGNMTVIIACSVTIPIILALIVLYILHRRVVRRQHMEDMKDPHKSLDFGLGENSGQSQTGKRECPKMGEGDQDNRTPHVRQMSMDMNLSSPYLLPPELQGSRESMNSLARTLHHNEDPYQPVVTFLAGDEKGRRTPSTMTGSSYGREIGRTSRATTVDSFPARLNSTPPKSPASPLDGTMSISPPPAYKEPFTVRIEPVSSLITESPPLQLEPTLPAVQQPPVSTPSGAWKATPMFKGTMDSAVDMGAYNSSAFENSQQWDVSVTGTQAQAPVHIPPPSMKSLIASSRPWPNQDNLVLPQTTTIVEESRELYESHAQMPEAPQLHHVEDKEELSGRNMQRLSRNYDHATPEVLHAPRSNNKRLSVGFRPLPPDEITESEDPEHRANRIRSFYKEYFEDNSHNQPMPVIPSYVQNNGVAFYDHDAGYPGDSAYFDPETNTFVMPYAQPVARRAMTPPPSGQRFPRHRTGRLGPYRAPGPHGPRPGSSASQGMPPPGPGSSASGPWGRSRAGSTASAGHFGPPRKMFPPPVALTTLPNPSKLKDDSFALMGSIDFAPPDTFAERASGRSQSPAGERRPYKLNLPIASPLVPAFDELPALPSPHVLSKCSTFTGLDFAPPRKFAESDSRSETGSIRSNRSGISAVQLGAIRNGAGRVSRLPGDSVFTQAALAEQLKPQWGIRP